MAATVPFKPQNRVKSDGQSEVIEIYALGHARAHAITSGDPVAEEVDTTVTPNQKKGVTASAFPWNTDQATTHAAFKLAFLGISNSDFGNRQCDDYQPDHIQYFKKNDRSQVLEYAIQGGAATWSQGDYYALAEDSVTPGRLSDWEVIAVATEAEALFAAKHNSGSTAKTHVELVFLHA